MAKHVCKHCGEPRSGHDCAVAKRRINKGDDIEFVIIGAAIVLSTPENEVERLFPPDPAPAVEDLQGKLDLDPHFDSGVSAERADYSSFFSGDSDGGGSNGE